MARCRSESRASTGGHRAGGWASGGVRLRDSGFRSRVLPQRCKRSSGGAALPIGGRGPGQDGHGPEPRDESQVQGIGNGLGDIYRVPMRALGL